MPLIWMNGWQCGRCGYGVTSLAASKGSRAGPPKNGERDKDGLLRDKAHI